MKKKQPVQEAKKIIEKNRPLLERLAKSNNTSANLSDLIDLTDSIGGGKFKCQVMTSTKQIYEISIKNITHD